GGIQSGVPAGAVVILIPTRLASPSNCRAESWKRNKTGDTMKAIARLPSTALMTAILLYPANAQAPQIPLQGRVLDPTSAAIPGAEITAIRDGSRTQLTAVSDRNGEFSLAV